MKKWLRRILIAAAFIGLTLGVLYEMSTHGVRGWWHGEATFQDRPTSYWHARIDSWVARFDSPGDAEQYLKAHSLAGRTAGSLILCKPPRPTFENRVRGWFGLALAKDDPPQVFGEFAYDAEPVLRELEAELRMKRFVDLARKKQFVW